MYQLRQFVAIMLAQSVVNISLSPLCEKRFLGCLFGLGLELVAGCGKKWDFMGNFGKIWEKKGPNDTSGSC